MVLTGWKQTLNTFFEWVMKLAFVNLFWLLFNLPFPLLLFQVRLSGMDHARLAWGVLVLVLIPFLLLPSSSALIACVRRFILVKYERASFKVYWKYYRENYKSNVQIGLVLEVLWLLFGANLFFYVTQVHSQLVIPFSVLLGYLIVFSLNVLCNNIHIQTGVQTSLKNALIITFYSPFTNLILAAAIISLTILSITFATYLILFFFGSFIALIAFGAYYKSYSKLALQ